MIEYDIELKCELKDVIVQQLKKISRDEELNPHLMGVTVTCTYMEKNYLSIVQLNGWLKEIIPEICFCDKNRILWIQGFSISKRHNVHIKLDCVAVNKRILYENHEEQRLQKLFLDNLKNKKYNKVQLLIKRLFKI